MNHGFVACDGNAFMRSSIFRSSTAAGSAAKTLGEPRSPSHFGISYSSTRWFRHVFQVRSETTR
ncbi:MAG: hypothetical protein QM704_13125 [Anaeromyxobacteraceae bacterium]